MFGTVARMLVKPGMEHRLAELSREYEQLTIPGHISTHVFRMDANPQEFYLATVWESREAYFANADSPEQDARYRKMLDILQAEPDWHDGEVVYSQSYSGSRRR